MYYFKIVVQKQLKLILELLGRPSPGELMSVLHSSVVQYLETLPEAPSTTLEELLPSANPVGIDLVRMPAVPAGAALNRAASSLLRARSDHPCVHRARRCGSFSTFPRAAGSPPRRR